MQGSLTKRYIIDAWQESEYSSGFEYTGINMYEYARVKQGS